MSIINGVSQFVDFNTSLASQNMVKVLYGGTIGARASSSRSKEEFREILTRDIPGWLSLFYLASIIQNALGYTLDKMTPSIKNGISLVKGPGTNKSFLQMLNPFTQYKVRSFDDIKVLGKLADITPENLKALRHNKAFVFSAGIAFSIAVLGMFIPWLNVKITRNQMMKQGQGEEPQTNFSPKINLTPDPSFKSPFNRVI